MKASKPAIARARLPALAAVPLALLAACSGEAEGPPTGVSEGEAQALEDAAEMLEAERLPEGVVPGTEAAPADPEPETAPGTASSD